MSYQEFFRLLRGRCYLATQVLFCGMMFVLANCGGSGSGGACDLNCGSDTRLVTNTRQCYCAREDGTRHGPYVELYDSGQKRIERNYVDGDLVGLVLTWTKEGTLLAEHTWGQDQEAEHFSVEFDVYDDADPVLSGQYHDGLPEEDWIHYHLANGSVAMITEYDNGYHCGAAHQCFEEATGAEILCSMVVEQEGCSLEGNEEQCLACDARGAFRTESVDGDDEDDTVYQVVVNHEEQYSIWPADKETPLGWRNYGFAGTKMQCLDQIMEIWIDMRPLSLRQKMEQARQSQ